MTSQNFLFTPKKDTRKPKERKKVSCLLEARSTRPFLERSSRPPTCLPSSLPLSAVSRPSVHISRKIDWKKTSSFQHQKDPVYDDVYDDKGSPSSPAVAVATNRPCPDLPGPGFYPPRRAGTCSRAHPWTKYPPRSMPFWKRRILTASYWSS